MRLAGRERLIWVASDRFQYFRSLTVTIVATRVQSVPFLSAHASHPLPSSSSLSPNLMPVLVVVVSGVWSRNNNVINRLRVGKFSYAAFMFGYPYKIPCRHFASSCVFLYSLRGGTRGGSLERCVWGQQTDEFGHFDTGVKHLISIKS